MLFFKLPSDTNYYSIDELQNGNTPVEFFGFDESQHISFEGNLEKITHLPEFTTNHLDESNTNCHPITKEEYTQKINKIIEVIKTNNLQKLVFSRQKIVDNFNKINLTESFQKLCESYSNAFVYLFKKEKHCWMGAFSELLGKYNHQTNIFETMSLAGTLPLKENWTTKEIEEQKPVTQYIENILSKFGEVEKSNTYNHISGKIKHLRTDFKTNVPEEQLENIIEALHPTPAVCGIPTSYCKKLIQEFENYDRELYAGYSKIKMDNITYFFVNLRCAKFNKNNASLFIGGGITRDSEAKKEWRETELKSHAILDHLVIS